MKVKSIGSRMVVLGMVVVCGFCSVAAGDTNPVGWWRFDDSDTPLTAENSGSFGSSLNGVLHYMTSSDWVGGITGTALDFDGINDCISIPALNLDSDTVTISAWIKRNGEQPGSDTGIVFSRDGSTVAGLCFGHDEGWNANHHLGYNWNDDQAAWDWDSGLFIPDNQWVFVALVAEPTKATLYIGENRALSSATRVLAHDMEEFDGVTFIASDDQWYGRFFKGSIDDVRIYNDALSSTEIAALYNSYLGPKASNPNPGNGATGIATDVVLSWDAGIDAVSHDVYFGTSYNDVVHATTSVPLGVYRGSQSSTFYIPTLAKDTTYYWRIDEVNESNVDSPWKGDVWSFKTWVEPNPVSWWRFDEGQGYTAYDSAGNNDGTVYGARWAGGQIGGALEFDGEDDYIDVADSPGLDITDGITIGMWIKPYLGMDCDERGNWRYLLRKGRVGWGAYNLIYEASWDVPQIGFTVVSGSAYRLWTNGAAYPDEFTYLAFTYDAETGEQKTYFNGNLDSQQITGGGFISNRSGPLRIGGGVNTGCPNGAGFFKGLIDDVVIYDNALSAAKIQQLYQEGLSGGRAFGPNPTDGATDVSVDTVLSWSPGVDAVSHDVYFGTNYNDVNDANNSWPVGSSVYRGRYPADTNSYDPCGLEPETTYYWRIDEVGSSNMLKGDVWSFTTIPFTAYNPRPANGARYTPVDPVLKWDAGFGAVSHDVYFGKSTPLPFKGNQTAAMYYPGVLPEHTSYWWRIDEVGPGWTIPGELWSFTTGSYRVRELRIIAWNIEFLGTREPRRTQEQLDAIAERMLGFEAAVFALQEIADVSVFEYIRSQLGPSWKIYHSGGWWGNINNTLLYDEDKVEMLSAEMLYNLSNPPYSPYPGVMIPVTGVFRPVGMLGAEPFRVIGVHCDPFSSAKRAEEGEWLRKKVVEFLNDPGETNDIILLGDLNGQPPGGAPHPQLQHGGYIYLLPKENGNSTHVYGGAIDHCYVTWAANDKLAKRGAFVIRPEHYGETPEEFRETYSDHYPVSIEFVRAWTSASYPVPEDRASGVSTDVVLGWANGAKAGSHDVYFGTDFNDVNDANNFWPVGSSVYKGRYPAYTNSYDPCDLEPETTYYWRIDEVNENDGNSPWKGRIWSLTTSKTVYVPSEYPTIQAAIDLAWDGVTIIVDERTYHENINFKGKNLTVRSADPNDKAVVAATVINGGNHGSVVTFSSSEDSNTMLAGFTITGGVNEEGEAGVLCLGEDVRPRIRNCVISRNGGTGICCGAQGSPGSPSINNCLIAGNRGVGIRVSGRGSTTVTNCTIVENGAEGINRHRGIATITNCVVWGNDGDAIYGGSKRVTYCNIEGGLEGEGNIDMGPCFVRTGYWDANGTAGDVNDDFWVDGDYRLLESSPCVDSGDPNYVAGPNETDLDGKPRIIGSRIDMGAYEFNHLPVGCIVGGARVVEAGEDCEARVVLDGSCSSDENSTAGTNDDINDFDWYEVIDACEPNSDIYIGSGEVIECNLGLGEHLIILEVTDKAGAFDSNEVVITVEDVTPPELSLFVEPSVLWPPNHRMVRIDVGWEASDNCDEQVQVSLIGISMNAAGDINDYVEIGDDGSIYLRAAKSKRGGSRIYTIDYEAVDDSGNVTEASATVMVPHSRGHRKLRERMRKRLYITEDRKAAEWRKQGKK